MQANSSSEDPITAINITPLVDVALVLVIIFMITLPYLMEKAMKVNSSSDKVVAVSSITEPILVEINERGIEVEGKSVPLQQLSGVLRDMIMKRKISAVAVLAQRKVAHGRVIEVLDNAIAAGAQELNMLESLEGKNGSH